MNDGDDFISLPAMAVDATADEVGTYGKRDVETGGFLLASPDKPEISVVAFAGDVGIVRRRYLFQISERALDRIFTFADDRGLWIPGQFHSHGMGAFLSPTDREHGLRVDGFVSAVIPTYAEPPRDVARWGWWRFADGEWVDVDIGRAGIGAVELVRFDEDGIRDG